MEGIIGYWKDNNLAVSKADTYVVTVRTEEAPKNYHWMVIIGKIGQPIGDVDIPKGSKRIPVAKFSKARGIDSEPAFAWWVPYTLQKRDIILSKVKARVQADAQVWDQSP